MKTHTLTGKGRGRRITSSLVRKLTNALRRAKVLTAREERRSTRSRRRHCRVRRALDSKVTTSCVRVVARGPGDAFAEVVQREKVF